MWPPAAGSPAPWIWRRCGRSADLGGARGRRFEDELAALPDGYAALLVARLNGARFGCVALKRLEEGACEMKRLYVRPAVRGTGLGRALVEGQ